MEKVNIGVNLEKKVLLIGQSELILAPSFFGAEVNKLLNSPEIALTLSYNNGHLLFLDEETEKITNYLSEKQLLENPKKGGISIHSCPKQKGINYPNISLVGYLKVQINSD